jgi:hypothetical protein
LWEFLEEEILAFRYPQDQFFGTGEGGFEGEVHGVDGVIQSFETLDAWVGEVVVESDQQDRLQEQVRPKSKRRIETTLKTWM